MEILIGGLCDGLERPKDDEKIVYAGIFGDGKIQVYIRRENGRLYYSHTINPVVTVQHTTAAPLINL